MSTREPVKNAMRRATSSSARTRGAQTAGPDAQKHLLRAADELFYREGVRAVGVDAVVERAGVNKMSLYRQFSSKDELVMAYLQRRDEQFFSYVEASLAKHPGEPLKQLQQLFEDLAARASSLNYRGCPFVNVACEFADYDHAARQFVFDNKARLLARITGLTREAGVAAPEALAESLALVVEGVYAASQTYGTNRGPVLAAPRVAAALIAGALAEPFARDAAAGDAATRGAES